MDLRNQNTMHIAHNMHETSATTCFSVMRSSDHHS